MTTLPLRLLRCTRGTSFMEFALVIPLMMTMLGGVLEMGRALHHHHVLEMSVRDATRYLARVPDTGHPAGTPCAAPTAGTAAFTARQLAMYGTTLAGQPPLLVYWTPDQPQTVCITTTQKTLTDETGATFDVTVVSMSVTVQYDDIGLLGFMGLEEALQLAAVHEEVHVGG